MFAAGKGHHLYSVEGLVAHWTKTQPDNVRQLHASLTNVMDVYHRQVAETKEAAERRRREVGGRWCGITGY